jgi:small subunit ribosomal protein S6
MALYESVFIARQDVSSSQVDGIADTLQKVIEDNGGQVAKREYWGLRNLAYKIKKNRKGHYAMFNIDAPAAALHEFERSMRFNEDILRYMTIKVDELDPEPSVVMQNKGRDRERGERGERGGRGGRRFEDRPPRDDGPKSDAPKADASGDDDDKPDAKASAETESAKTESAGADEAAKETEKEGGDA